MSHQKTLADLFNVTFSPESASGVTPSDSPDGPMTDLFGQVVALASLSLVPAPDSVPPTNAISGPTGSISSASAALQLSLESRLKQQLTTAGSTLFKLTWKVKTTPAGRSVCLLRASAPRTSDNDCGSWLTTTTSDGNGIRELDGTRSGGLNTQATLASWPTPNTMEGGQTSRGGKRKGELLMGGLVSWPTLAGWATPRATDPKCGGTYTENCQGKDLPKDATLASWATPQASDNVEGARTHMDSNQKCLGRDMNQFLSGWPTTSTRDHKGGYLGGAHERRENQHGHAGRDGAANFWADCDWLSCRDGKARPVESGTFPLAHGSTARVGRLRAYGNAIVPQVAQALIEAYLSCN
jgi:hypothetical protein